MERKNSNKEIDLFENDKSTKETDKKVQKKVVTKKESDKVVPKKANPKPSKGDHSFHKEQKARSKKTFKSLWKDSKVFKHSIIWGSVIAVGLSVGLGVGLGVNWNPVNDNANLGDGIWDYIDDNINELDNQKTKTLDEAVLFSYDKLINNTLGPNGESVLLMNPTNHSNQLRNAESNADDAIQLEKEGLQATYGNTWEDEWTKSLYQKGFENETEYRTNKIATSLKPNITNLYTSSDSIIVNGLVDDVSEVTATYQSSISKVTGSKLNIKYVSDSWSGLDASGSGQPRVNVQDLFTLYLQSQKPLAFRESTINWSIIGNSNLNGLDGERIEFSDLASVEDIWLTMEDLYGDSVSGDLDGFDTLNNINTISAISRLGSDLSGLGDPSSQLNFYSTLFYGGETGSTTVKQNISDTTTIQDFAYSLNEAIGVTLQTNNNNSYWPLYGETDPVPDQQAALDAVQSSDFNRITPTDLEDIGSDFWTTNYDTMFNTLPNVDPTLSNQRALSNTIDIDGVTYLMSVTATGLTFTQIEQFDQLQALTSNDVSIADLATDPIANAGVQMITSDLNKLVDSEADESRANPDYSIIADFTSWITENTNFLLLNGVLQDQEFLDIIQDPDGLAVTDEEISLMVSQDYNSLYQTQQTNYLSIYSTLSQQTENNSLIYQDMISDFLVTEFSTNIDETIKYFNFDVNAVNVLPKSISQILADDGDLN